MSTSTASTQESSQQEIKREPEDILNILVATDIHLGYGENDLIRAQDTFNTFEEVLSIAQNEEVDFLLLGGDLFHETRPSTYCIHKCTELLKKYCLGDRPVQIEFLSDASHNFGHTGIDIVNYEDPNLNISLPVFSIHGNHDDPTGERQVSALDLLASTGLVNYFGKYTNHTQIDIEPIILRKGATKLALYGLSHIKDERLGRLFIDKKVTIMVPPNPDDWFHLMVLHQNRANRGAKTFIPDELLPKVLDLVIWGHEHDCRIEPEQNIISGVQISQPGSTVATSLSVGEATPKKIGLLRIHQNSFNMTAIPLQTVRPFIYREIVLKDLDEIDEKFEGFVDGALSNASKAIRRVENEVEKMLVDARNLGRLPALLPLLRLIVGYTEESQTFNAIRFGQKYSGVVANPEDMVKLKSCIKKPINRHGDDDDTFEAPLEMPSRVEDLVMEHFENNPEVQLTYLPLKALNEAVKKCIDTSDIDAPVVVVNEWAKELRQLLEQEMPGVDEVNEVMHRFQQEKNEEEGYVERILNDSKRKGGGAKQSNNGYDEITIIDDDDNDDDDGNSSMNARPSTSAATPVSRPARGPGSRGGRGSRGPRRGGRRKASG